MRVAPLGLVVFAGLSAAFPGRAATAAPVSFAPDPSGAVTFVMPSGNIACIYTPAGGSSVYVPADGGPELACDRAEPTYLRFTLAASGPAEVRGDVADPGCCGGTNAFAYGKPGHCRPSSAPPRPPGSTAGAVPTASSLQRQKLAPFEARTCFRRLRKYAICPSEGGHIALDMLNGRTHSG